MTDGIPKISPQINTSMITDVKDANEAKAQEVSARITENNTELKIIRDVVETVRNSSSGTELSKLLNQQGNQDLKSTGFSSKVDPANANLLNQQLITARLGTPLFANKTQTESKNSALSSNLSDLKSQKIGLTNQIRNAEIRMEGLEDAGKSQAEKAREAAANTGTPITQQDPGKISERSQTVPTYLFKEAEVAREEKIKDCNNQIDTLKHEMQNLKDQIIGLDQELAKMQEEYQRTGDPGLLKKMDSIRSQIDDLKHQIKEKADQVKDLENDVDGLKGRQATEETKRAQDINS